ncbi:hypothetical protein NC653_019690 [Populus alba x Populus x berolinensis]|uniref:Uncharacterized protein n=1 Tax=Populus alba x Populus x berolinensis TaxID=444605 RepID=A0AAD6QJJ5_9ROSI|nr:hypothetical protein NC653_019690 [Populus alba x Populus x berolinensis]
MLLQLLELKNYVAIWLDYCQYNIGIDLTAFDLGFVLSANSRDGIKFRGSSSEEWREGVALVSDEDIASGVKTWENALVGYVWGPIPSTEYDMPIDRLFLDKLILKFVDLECRNYGNVKFYSKGLGVYLFDFESFEAKQLVSDKGGVLNNSYRWGTPTATCPKQFSWSEAFHIPISKVFELWGV